MPGIQDPVYGRPFALAYQRVWEDRYAVPMSRHFPRMQRALDVRGKLFADVACGTGRFARELALQGYRGVGLDQSSAMVQLARESCADVKPDKLRFEEQSMAGFALSEPVDFVTCWFDSVNYLSTLSEVEAFFVACYRSITPGGCLLFDFETEAAFLDRWERRSLSASAIVRNVLGQAKRRRFRGSIDVVGDRLRSDAERSTRTFRRDMVVVRATCRYNACSEEAVTELRGRVWDEGRWLRIHENHVQRVFCLSQLVPRLHAAGFHSVTPFCLSSVGSLVEHDLPEDVRRIYVHARKEPSTADAAVSDP